MKTYGACIPCIMKQAYNAAVRATHDEALIQRIMIMTAGYLEDLNLDQTPADSSNYVYRITREITGNSDPYHDEKRSFNEFCMKLIPELREKIDTSEDPLYFSIKAAIAGNLIDLGIGHTIDIHTSIINMFSDSFAIDDYKEFRLLLGSGRKKILYLGDNAGEIVFDRLLVEKLVPEHEVIFVVKAGPVINDALIEDARYAGLTELARVIDTGSDGIGVRWDSVSGEFMQEYKTADLIISKGQGNFETMDDKSDTIFFLLRAKCDCIAQVLGVHYGDIVFKKGVLSSE